MPSTAISAQGSTVQVSSTAGGAKTITAITVGAPAIATATRCSTAPIAPTRPQF